jgi:hypothetical protein
MLLRREWELRKAFVPVQLRWSGSPFVDDVLMGRGPEA